MMTYSQQILISLILDNIIKGALVMVLAAMVVVLLVLVFLIFKGALEL